MEREEKLKKYAMAFFTNFTFATPKSNVDEYNDEIERVYNIVAEELVNDDITLWDVDLLVQVMYRIAEETSTALIEKDTLEYIPEATNPFNNEVFHSSQQVIHNSTHFIKDMYIALETFAFTLKQTKDYRMKELQELILGKETEFTWRQLRDKLKELQTLSS